MREPLQAYVYRNSALAEVICEARWDLVKLTAIPDAAIDPSFPAASTSFLNEIKGLGFGVAQRLVPPGVPLEMLPGQPVWQVRRAPAGSPLYQLGPGVMTCNITPPYPGWSKFAPILAAGLSALEKSYATAGGVRLSKLSLRYLNGFSAKHGFKTMADFLPKIGFKFEISPAVRDLSGDEWNARNIAATMALRISNLPGSSLVMAVQSGQIQGNPAGVLEIRVEGPPPNQNILEWFDAAREVARTAFEAQLDEETRELLGPKDPI